MSKTIVITGASDGIGAALAKRLKDKGNNVAIVGRSKVKTAAVAAELAVPSYLADFAKLSDVRALAADLERDYPRIDVLINNAGTWFDEYALTEDGFERTMQVNHLAPALLTELLLPTLTRAEGEPPSIAQWTTSMSSRWVGKLDAARIGVDDEIARARYKNMRVYGTAKLACSVYVAEFERRHTQDGIAAVSVHPGMVATSFGTNSDSSRKGGSLFQKFMTKYILTTPDGSAARLQHFAEGIPGTDWIPGDYYQGKRHYKHAQVADLALGVAVWNRTRELLQLAN
ncbi:MAG: SDR family NAD(P)-dependent oxidoreductase [Promicromonosporaceae bacterium]|nr:SDR family NAD(P)-dependent oxidoreductase [Promicromonosporaceae bacterium]